MVSTEFELVNGSVALKLDPRVYRLGAIKKAAYRLAERCCAVIGTTEGNVIQVSLNFKTNVSESEARETCRLFYQELLDQELREQISEETAPIRTLILAHAFSKIDLIKRG